ncbi:MAG TPA: (d)CMP kinase [Gammaproteobacteria bacterium]|nr:(d)CMP kinase [Gammaproteobacteria bacterium]
MRVPVITLDGPSGSGKGTISQALAEELGWHHLDSGALYRLLAYAALQESVALDDAAALAALAARLQARYRLPTRRNPEILLDGKDVGEALRSEACGNAASRAAALPEVRQALLQWQRHYRQPPGLVTDGRDMGTVVFPDANLKLYLVARPEVRAMRRYNQLKNKGINVDLAELVAAVEHRDRRDSAREASPLRPAEDALVVDNSDLGESETLRLVLDKVRKVV